MKRVLFFTFKLLEICAAVLVYIGLGYFGLWCETGIALMEGSSPIGLPFYNLLNVGIGLVFAAIIIAICFGLYYFVPAWIKLNRKWVNNIVKD